MIKARIKTEYIKYDNTPVDFIESATLKIVATIEHDSKQTEKLNIDELSKIIEEKFSEIPLQDNQEKVIFGICSVIDNSTLKVTSDVFVQGSKISIIKAINTLKEEMEAEDFNDIINYFKTNTND